MAHSPSILRSALLTCVLTVSFTALSGAAESARIVFQSGKSIPLAALGQQANQLVVQTEADGFSVGQAFPIETVDHIYGDKPAAVNQAVALLLMDKPKEAIKLLEPVVIAHRLTAKIPGNFWLEAARALLVARALNGNAKDCTDLGKEIADATPAQGIDPYFSLGKALLQPVTVKIEDRIISLRDLAIDTMPADLCSYASYFRGNLLNQDKKSAEALEAYLSGPCLFPSGGLVLNAAAELQAADFLISLKRNEEGVAILRSAVRDAPGTVIAEEANKRLESLK